MPRKDYESLPEDIRIMATSYQGGVVNDDIIEEFKLGEKEQVFLSIVERVFLKKLSLTKLISTLEKELDISAKQAKDVALALAGRRFLAADSWIGNVKSYVAELGGDHKEYAKDIDAIQAEVESVQEFNKQLDAADQADDESYREYKDAVANYRPEAFAGKQLTPLEEKKEYLRVLSESLPDIVTIEDQDYLRGFNYNLLYHVSEDATGEYLKQVVDAVSRCNAEVSSDMIVDGDSELPGTVENWIANFIKSMGTDNISDLTKAQYFATSNNVKKLSNDTRQVLSSIFDVYINLKTYPDAYVNVPVEQWEVVPLVARDVKIDNLKARDENAIGKDVNVAHMVEKRRYSEDVQEAELTEERIMAMYQGTQAEQSLIEQAENGLKAEFGFDMQRIQKYVIDMLESPEARINKTKILAGLRILAKAHTLQSFIGDGSNISKVKSFFKNAFIDVLGYNQSDAARYTLHILNFADISPEDIAHFDEEARRFKFD